MDVKEYVARYGEDACNTQGVQVVRRWLDRAEHKIPRCGFALQGAVGSGKSTLLQAFACSALVLKTVHMYSTRKVQREIGEMMKTGGAMDVVDRLSKCQILILDELGQEEPYKWWLDQFLYLVVDERYARGLPTIYGTVYGPDQLLQRWAGGAAPSECATSLVDRITHRTPIWAQMTYRDDESHRKPEIDY